MEPWYPEETGTPGLGGLPPTDRSPAQHPPAGPGAGKAGRTSPRRDVSFENSPLSDNDFEPHFRSGPRCESKGSIEVVLPALNEEKGVGNVIDRIPRDKLVQSGFQVRVWVVDGKSKDATLEVARNRGANTFVQTGDGKGNGVRQLLDHIIADGRGPDQGSRVFVMLDADGSYPPEAIPKFVEALKAGSDVVVGSRFLGEVQEGAITPLNRLGNRILSRLAGFLFGTPVSDVCTGMWAFREDSLRRLGLAADGFDLEADLFASSCESGARLRELPIDYHRRIGDPKLVPLRTGLLIAWRLLLKRLNRREGVVPRIDRRKASLVEDAT